MSEDTLHHVIRWNVQIGGVERYKDELRQALTGI
jgi:hypothetical protein